MNRDIIQKIIACMLVLNTLVTSWYVLSGMPDALVEWKEQEWRDAYLLLKVMIAYQLLICVTNIGFGYLLFKGEEIRTWLFCSLFVFAVLSNLIGAVLAVGATILRWWPDRAAESKV